MSSMKPTAMAFLLYIRILASAGATNVLLVTFLVPISALLLGVGVLGEVIKGFEDIGMGVHLFGTDCCRWKGPEVDKKLL